MSREELKKITGGSAPVDGGTDLTGGCVWIDGGTMFHFLANPWFRIQMVQVVGFLKLDTVYQHRMDQQDVIVLLFMLLYNDSF